MNSRLPKRSEKMPASGETTIVAPVQTSSLTPACSGVLPSTFCRNWLRKKIEPNIPKYIASETTLVTAKPRLAKNSSAASGRVGAQLVRSTNATTSTAPAASETTTSASSSSRATGRGPARRRARTGRSRRAPGRGRSKPRSRPWLSLSRAGRERDQHGADRDVDPEDPVPVSELDHRAADERAERDGDAADPRPDAERHAALVGRERVGQQRQRQRRGDRGADALRGAGGDQRADRRGERRAAAEATVNSAIPAMNMRLRPNRSPSAAPVSSSTA